MPTIRGDDGYYEISKSLVDGNGFGSINTQGVFAPNPLRPPVWPFLIAGILLLFKSYWAVAFFEIIMGSFIPIIGMKIVRFIFGDRRVITATGVLMAIEPYAIFLSFIFYTETSFTFFFLISIIFLLKYFKDATMRNIVWFSVFFGLATLIKPTIQYLPVVVVALLIFHSRRNLSKKVFVHTGIFIILFCLIISSWLYRNKSEFGVWGMSAQPAFNLYVYLVPTVLAIENKTDFKTEWLAFVRKDGFDESTINLSNSKEITRLALAVLKKHPKELLISLFTTVVTFFTHDGLLNIFGYAGVPLVNTFQKPALGMIIADPAGFISFIRSSFGSPIILIVFARIAWFIIAILAFIGVFRSLCRRGWLKTEILFSIAVVGYFAATTAINGFGVNARFKIPVEVFIFAFAVYGLLGLSSSILSKLKKNEAFNNNSML
ncbi:MAG: glycosyltransferase family 39 protein [Patescibacteria group bacterium]